MNDLTPDELKKLLSCVNGEIRHNIDAESLKLKLKSLIEEKEHQEWIKVGNKAWVFYTDYGRDSWPDFDTVVYPSELELIYGEIVFIDEGKDSVHIKTPISDSLIDMGYTFFHEWAYPTKELAIKGMMKRMEELMHE